MKILHISDIHIGIHDNGLDRNSEFEQVFEAVYKDAMNVDLIVIAGDLMHYSFPPGEDTHFLIFKFLKTLSDIKPVILIKGNHDWRGLNSTALLTDNIDYIDEPTTKIIDSYKFFLSPYYKYFGDKEIIDFIDENRDEAYQNIFFGHLAIKNTYFTKNEDDIGEAQIDPNIFGGFRYVGLGHIHRPQSIPNKNNVDIYYSGSLICNNFDERYEHGYIKIDIQSNKNDIEYINVKCRDFVVIEEKYDDKLFIEDNLNEIMKKIEKYQDKEVYIKVKLTTEGNFPPYINSTVKNLSKNIIKVDTIRTEYNNQTKEEDFRKTKNIVELFEIYLKGKNKTENAESLVRMLQEYELEANLLKD